MGASRIGETGVLVSVITALEQEHGTELEIVQTLFLLATEGIRLKSMFTKNVYSCIFF